MRYLISVVCIIDIVADESLALHTHTHSQNIIVHDGKAKCAKLAAINNEIYI